MTFVPVAVAVGLFMAYYPGHSGKRLTWTNRWEQ